MSAGTFVLPTALRRRQRAARGRAVLAVTLGGLAVLGGLAAPAWAAAGATLAIAAALLAAGVTAVLAWKAQRRYDRPWLLRQLDAADPRFEDSAALALDDAPTASALQALQRARIRARIDSALAHDTLPALSPPLPWPRLRQCFAIALLLVLVAVLLPLLRGLVTTKTVTAAAMAGTGAAPLKLEASLTITPPAYTGLDARKQTTLDAKAPAGSVIGFALRPDREVRALALVFDDGTRLALRREGMVWRGQRVLEASALYRVEADGVAADATKGPGASRLDAIPDAPPEVIVREPAKTLTLLTAEQKSWSLAFEARDDYGLGEAKLTVTLAQGTGDNVKTTEQVLVLEGRGDARSRRYQQTLDLGTLGYAKGDDLIVRLSVADNRPPQPNVTESASFILRWPPEKSSESAGMEGLVQKTLPAYFRSERQIIIDTEALQAQRGSLAARSFAKQSDELGVDQKVLRLRYGQFLGEGFETAADPAPQDEKSAGKGKDDAVPAGGSDALKQLPDDGDHAAKDSPVIGRSEDVLHEFGHAHDDGEAATLLDPETRRILKAALDEMWQAELHLRQAEPDLALPYEYKALDYIKQVQQAERIYLARAGLELPQTDATRRLSGKREGLSDRTVALPPPAPVDSPVPAVWSALAHGEAIDTAALGAWVRQHSDQVPDALGVLAAADRVQHDPACTDCRRDLQNRLWPLLPAPPAAVTPREAPDAAGAAYLDALSGSGSGAAK